ncbi:uncharacterized protein K02A2.6-like [Orbicella faveolata]|uniref:uncharacterized protein K02A2.6-like n=1 Tax=Orbicella faveolata TaxID=48498 RepID=UPI0009E5B356|nr:uncharacterized protein K02A2.6-like [Orbicella faveolata]
MEAGAKDTLELQDTKESDFNKVPNGSSSVPNVKPKSRDHCYRCDGTLLHMNHPSVTSGTKHTRNVGNEFAAQERVRTSPDEERMKSPICLSLRWMMTAMMRSHHKAHLKKFEKLLDENSEVFQDEIGKLKSTKAKLTLKEGSKPMFCKARSVPYAMKPKVEVQLKRLEEEGIFRKVRFSNWSTSIVHVVKPNDAVRICGDYKITVNPQLQTEEYFLTRIGDVFAELAGGGRFTKIDLKQPHAYHQMEVEEESQEYLTINTHQGLHRYNRLVFGIASASTSATWQRSMDQILEEIEGRRFILDDMIIAGKDDEGHLDHLVEVLKRLKEHGLLANRRQMQVFPDEDHLLRAHS